MKMPSQNEKDVALKQLFVIRQAYNDLINNRIGGKISDQDFTRLSRELELQGMTLKQVIGINTAGVGGVFCKGCGKFFLGPDLKENMESLDSCRKHTSTRIKEVPHPNRN